VWFFVVYEMSFAQPAVYLSHDLCVLKYLVCGKGRIEFDLLLPRDDPSNTVLLGPHRVFTPNRTSIRLAVLHNKVECNCVTDRQALGYSIAVVYISFI